MFILGVTYTTGGTFGKETGCLKVVGAFTDREKAREVAKAIRKDADEDACYYSKTKPTAFGKYIKEYNIDFYPPWNGYFESIDIIPFAIDKPAKESF